MCESLGALDATRWPQLVIGILLLVGAIELGWKSRRIAVGQQRRLQEMRERPLLRMFDAMALGGFFGPELHRISLILVAAVGLLAGAVLLFIGICQ